MCAVAGLENYDLDADFDPEEHDRQMGGAFADETYYAGAADPVRPLRLRLRADRHR